MKKRKMGIFCKYRKANTRNTITTYYTHARIYENGLLRK